MSHEIIPAIIAKNFAELDEKISLMKGLVPVVHVDIMDGSLTLESSWPYKKQDTYFEEIQSEQRGMPCWEDVDFEAHLMVKNPEALITHWLAAGAKAILVHPEATHSLEGIINSLRGLVEIGVVLTLDTPVEKIESYIDDIDIIQCMSIAHIGAQGLPFDEQVVEKVRAIKEKYPTKIISVDGGINEQNAHLLVDAGADRLVVGSAIYSSQNFVDTIHNLREL